MLQYLECVSKRYAVSLKRDVENLVKKPNQHLKRRERFLHSLLAQRRWTRRKVRNTHILLRTHHRLEVRHVTELIARCSILTTIIECECLRSRALAYVQQRKAHTYTFRFRRSFACAFLVLDLQMTRTSSLKCVHVTCAVGFI